MKIAIVYIFLFLVSSTGVIAQCKPDKTEKDPLTKAERAFWGAEIYKRSLGNKLLMDMNTTFPSITCIIGKNGDRYFIRINLVVTQKSTQSAAFNAPFRGDKESIIKFGFVEGGEPLSMKFEDVQNDQVVDYNKNYVYSTSFTQYYSKEEINRFRDILSMKVIDMVELNLQGNKKLADRIRDKQGEKMQEKFICFYDFIANE